LIEDIFDRQVKDSQGKYAVFRNNWDDYPQSLEKNIRLKPGNGRNVQPQMSHLRQSVDIVRKAFWIS
jgi:hypothetical protein